MRNAFSSALPTARVGRAIDYHDAIESTMERGAELIRTGTPDGMVVIADHQTAGRGRRGRRWGYGPPGSQLLASWLLRVPRAEATLFAVLTGVALLRAARSLGVGELSLKWPNDLLLDGRKVAGVLSISVEGPSGEHWLDLGTGIDVHTREHPEEVRSAVTSFARSGQAVDRLALLARAAEEIEKLQGGDAALADAAAEWRRSAPMLGRPVRVAEGDATYDAEAVALEPDGALLVRRDGGALERVVAADVSVRPA